VSNPAPPARRSSFRELLEQLPLRIGEIVVDRLQPGEFTLRHRDDVTRADLEPHLTAEAAAEIARYDDAGEYRPLKTAPNLRHAWALRLRTAAECRLALDLFYPGRLAAYEAWAGESLTPTSFRETLARQTGMYRVAAKISDDRADVLIGSFCRSDGGCLRTILWTRDNNATPPSTLLPPQKFDPAHDQTGRRERTTPLLCQEICNLLVAAARETVKAP
jgi:sirohydrochlorin cobaltochelatase